MAKKNKAKKRQPEFLSDDEQELLLNQPNKRWPTGHRNKVIIEFLLYTGARVSELCNMKWNRINLNTGLVQIRDGKGGKDRTIYADVDTLKSLQEWRERQSEQIGATEYVFTTLKGNPVSPRYVQKMIKQYREKADIGKRVTPHTLRHTFATSLFRDTKNIILTQQALGHEDVSTTMIYTHLENDQVKDEMNKAAEARRKRMKGNK